jgi:hypothetical protein
MVDRLGEVRDGLLEIVRIDRSAGAHVAVIPRGAAQVVHVGGLGGEADRFADIRDGAVGIELGHEDLAAAVIGVDEFRVETDRVGEIRDGAVEIGLGLPGERAVVISAGEFPVCRDRGGEVGDRAIELPLGLPGGATAIESVGVLGVEPDALVEVGDGTLEIALGLPGETAVRVDVDMAGAGEVRPGQRIDLDRRGEIRDGALGVAFFPPGQSAVVIGQRIFRVDADRLREVRHGAIVVALVVPGEAPAHIGDGARLYALDRILGHDGAACDAGSFALQSSWALRLAPKAGAATATSTPVTIIEVSKRMSGLLIWLRIFAHAWKAGWDRKRRAKQQKISRAQKPNGSIGRTPPAHPPRKRGSSHLAKMS